MSGTIDFDGINAAALRSARSFLQELLPGGKFRSLQYLAKNPRRDDGHLGSFTAHCRKGVWKDFANGDGGSDFISLYAYVRGIGQADAARELADKFDVPLLKPNGHSGRQRNGAPAGTSSKVPTNSATAESHDAKVYSWGDDGPPRQPDELRRHVYSADRFPMRIKIKSRNGRYTNWYRTFSNGLPIGWRAKKPDDYSAIPYLSAALNPFDAELIGDEILWPEGEKDVDSLSGLNLPAFTFGGVGDGLPDGIDEYLKDRRLVILADNDEPGGDHAEKKAFLAHAAGAVSIKVVHFPELAPKEDVSNFIVNGGTAEQLIQRIDSAPPWLPAPTTRTENGLALNSITAALVAAQPTSRPKKLSGFGRVGWHEASIRASPASPAPARASCRSLSSLQ
jgi:putative DNA primase/helicase